MKKYYLKNYTHKTMRLKTQDTKDTMGVQKPKWRHFTKGFHHWSLWKPAIIHNQTQTKKRELILIEHRTRRTLKTEKSWAIANSGHVSRSRDLLRVKQQNPWAPNLQGSSSLIERFSTFDTRGKSSRVKIVRPRLWCHEFVMPVKNSHWMKGTQKRKRATSLCIAELETFLIALKAVSLLLFFFSKCESSLLKRIAFVTF